MGFRLKAGESPSKGIRRVVKAQIEKAIEAVAKPSPSTFDEQIHRARRCFKRIRATLKVARPGLSKQAYRRENERFRDIGRILSPMRDVAALNEAFHALIDRFGDQGQPHEFETVLHALDSQERTIDEVLSNNEKQLHKLGRELEEARAGLDAWITSQLDWNSVEAGFRQVFKSARNAFKTAQECPADPQLHEWRKRVKDLGFALELLDLRNNRIAPAVREQAEALGKTLGHDRDLAMLRSLLVDSPDPKVQVACTVIVPLVAARRSALQREAFAIGESIAQHRARELVAGNIPTAHRA